MISCICSLHEPVLFVLEIYKGKSKKANYVSSTYDTLLSIAVTRHPNLTADIPSRLAITVAFKRKTLLHHSLSMKGNKAGVFTISHTINLNLSLVV